MATFGSSSSDAAFVLRLISETALVGIHNATTNGTMNDSSTSAPSSIDGGGGGGSPSGIQQTPRKDAYEFVAFLLWYLFLVLCCVLPTCCAYRRRRYVEQRLAQQQATFDQFQNHQNLYMVNHMQHPYSSSGRYDMQHMDSEIARAERTKRITEALKSTTFVSNQPQHCRVSRLVLLFSNHMDILDFVSFSCTKFCLLLWGDRICMLGFWISAFLFYIYIYISQKTVSEPDIIEKTEENKSWTGTLRVVDVEMGDDLTDAHALQLPKNQFRGDRIVPGGCAICLSAYEPGDCVSWSPKAECQHAFHQSCIIPWLAKKDEPKCPCCRQDFCIIPPITPAQMAQLASLSNNNHNSAGSANNPLNPFGLFAYSYFLEPTPFSSNRVNHVSSTTTTTSISNATTSSLPMVSEAGRTFSQDESSPTRVTTTATTAETPSSDPQNGIQQQQQQQQDESQSSPSIELTSTTRTTQAGSQQPLEEDHQDTASTTTIAINTIEPPRVTQAANASEYAEPPAETTTIANITNDEGSQL